MLVSGSRIYITNSSSEQVSTSPRRNVETAEPHLGGEGPPKSH